MDWEFCAFKIKWGHHRGEAAAELGGITDAASALCGIPQITCVESWLIMSVIIVIRHDLPEEKMFFPSAREKKKKLQKCQLPIYAVPVIFEPRKTNVRDVSPPKSWGWKMDNREELVKKAIELALQLTPEQLAIAVAEALRAGEKESA